MILIIVVNNSGFSNNIFKGKNRTIGESHEANEAENKHEIDNLTGRQHNE